MADDSWTPPDPVDEQAEPLVQPLSDFYQAMRRVECEHRHWPRLGLAHDPAEEAVRLGQDPSLAFQGSTLVSEEPRAAGKVARINVRFFGVFGSNGPLPIHLSEYAYQRQHSFRDPTFARFADMFHHRLLSLFYRAWANAEPVISRDRPTDDHFAKYLGALVGQASERDSDSQTARTVRYMARHFIGQTRHPEGLVKTLRERLGTPIELEEFVGEWFSVPDEYCWRLSSGSSASAAPMGILGTSTRVGTQIWERQFKFRIVVGPMPRRTYERFLPRGDLMPQLVELVQRYIGHELSWDVRLLLDHPDLQPTTLGLRGRLGETSYVGNPTVGLPPSWQALVLDPLAKAS
ncbi:MAG: type secretion protein family [Myxococcaceae bacterium]|nr:type secretion protein family [Myxococcaceae bacterium]